jgi:two-component system, OmpR family, heavy metal sensor histidine kinase CusS
MAPSTEPSGSRPKESRSFLAEATSLLAHDLNNQLALLLANLEFLDEFTRELPDQDPDVRDTVTVSQASLQHMMNLVRNMTDIARMEDPGLTPSPVATDVVRLVQGTVREYRPLHDRGEVKMRVECPDILRAEVDPVLLRRIAHNLISNGRRFVDKDGVVRVTAALERTGTNGPDTPGGNGDVLVFSVANTGPAIAPERRETLFNKYRVNPDGRIARGMGLYFCRLACEAHGGTLALSEEADFPTVFTARLACGGVENDETYADDY